MKRLIFLVMMLASLGVAAQAQASTWPAHCHNFKCVNKHLNGLHKAAKAQAASVKTLQRQVNSLTDTAIPTGNALQAEIDALASQHNTDVSNIESQINGLWNQPALSGCWSQLAVSRFTDSQDPSTVYTQGWPYNDYASNGPTSNGLLDLARANQPRDGFIYRMIFNSCTSG